MERSTSQNSRASVYYSSADNSSSSYEGKMTLDDAVNEVLGKLLSFENDLQRDIFVIKFWQKLPPKQKETLYEQAINDAPNQSSSSDSKRPVSVRSSMLPFVSAEKDILRRFRKSKRASIDVDLPASKPAPTPLFIEVQSNHMCENEPRSIENYTPLLSARRKVELTESEIIYILNKVIDFIEQGRWKLDGDVVVRARDIYVSENGEFVPAFRQCHPVEKASKKARYSCDMYWKPPELLLPEEEVTTPPVPGEKKEVVWNIGVLAYELAEKFPPYFDKLPPNAYRLIVNPYSDIPKLSGNYSQEFRNFVTSLLQRDLRTRPTFEEMRKSSFLSSDTKTKNLTSILAKMKAATRSSAEDNPGSDSSSTGSDESTETSLKESGHVYNSPSMETLTYNWNNNERQNTVIGTENLNIQDLVKRLRDPIKGVKIAKRSYKLKSYYSCFIGSELVDWLVINLPLKDREEAVAIGEMLMFRGIIVHVTSSEPFSDGYKFFRFGQDVIRAAKKENERVGAPFVLGLPSLYFGENEINYLVARMTDAEGGLEIKNRRYHLRTYESCFIGQDAVTWMVKEFQLQSREEAVKLGQLLLQRGTFHHVHDDHNFEDKFLFFRFYKDEKKREKEKENSHSHYSSGNYSSGGSLSKASTPAHSRPGSTNSLIQSPSVEERRNSIFQSHVKSLIELLGERKTETNSPEELEQRKIQFISGDLKKAIQTRGSIAAEEITWLISTMSWEQESEKVRETAAATLASFAFPEEFSPFITKQIMNQDGFHKLLWYASTGLIKVHREIDRSEIQFGSLIAQGAGGMVFEGLYKDQAVAVKVFNEDNIAFSVQDFTREVALMSMLRHENLVTCLGACTKTGNYFIVQELMKGGSLHQFLHNEGVQWDLELLVDVALQISKPTAYLHNLEIIHRDLKSMNYLLATPNFSQPVIKLTDFGISRAVESLEDVELEGTPQWMAPEVFNKEKYDGASDVYSFAIVMWEMVTRQDPWITVPLWKIPELVTKGERPPLPPSCPEEFANLIRACWQTDPSQRPDFNQITDYLMKLKAGETPKSRALTSIGSQRKNKKN